MPAYITVSGAYGRDYTSVKQARVDWDNGKDFVIRSLGYHTYMSRSDWGGEVIMLRYARDAKIGVLAGRNGRE